MMEYKSQKAKRVRFCNQRKNILYNILRLIYLKRAILSFRLLKPCKMGNLYQIKYYSVWHTNLCNENCTSGTKQVSIKYGTENRNICLLRASRLPWIVDIIKLASRDDKSVKVWMKPGNGKQSPKLYLRYNQYGVDYVLIFSAEKRFYRLISAFPVFFTSEKRDFSKDCEKYSWSYFGQ